jgi:fermentation-respiration switch protein FrsA (DUF1100 family)
VFFTSADGTRLHGWFVHAEGEPKGTVVHLHGNAQNLTSHYGFVAWLPRAGYNVFAFDYRGYGRSEGSPTIPGVMADGAAAIEYARGRADVDGDRILVLGQSLGAAVAATVVGRQQCPGVRGVVLDSGFSSFSGIVADKMRATMVLAPLSFLAPGLIDDADSPDRYVGRIAPRSVLLLHGKADRIIGSQHSERLYALAGEPKELHLVEGADHLEAMNNGGGAHRRITLQFFQRCLKNGSAGG